MNRIRLDSIGSPHALWNPLIENPPEGYEVTLDEDSVDRTRTKVASRVPRVFTALYRISRHIIPPKLALGMARGLRYRVKDTSDIDITITTGHVLPQADPWMIELESPTHPVSYSRVQLRLLKRPVGKILCSEHCKGIICWTESCRKAVESVWSESTVQEKAHVIPLAPDPKILEVNPSFGNEEYLDLLFVGSSNIEGQFATKGGREALYTFLELKDRIPNLRLTIRSGVPEGVRETCQREERIFLFEERIPWTKMHALFQRSDIFLFPSYQSPARIFLDAMSYGLPIVTTDVWANPDIVSDGENGIVISSSDRLDLVDDQNIPKFRAKDSALRNRVLRKHDPDVVSSAAAAVERLAENPGLRESMGREGRRRVAKGKHSPETRNASLKRLFDSAVE